MTKFLNSTGLAQLVAKIKQALNGKQDTLVSGTSIKTVNSTSLLGSGDLDVKEFYYMPQADMYAMYMAAVESYIPSQEALNTACDNLYAAVKAGKAPRNYFFGTYYDATSYSYINETQGDDFMTVEFFYDKTYAKYSFQRYTSDYDGDIPSGYTVGDWKASFSSESLDEKQDGLIWDNTPTANSPNAVNSGSIYTALQRKQDTLTFDSTPTASSTNPVTSGGVKTALDVAAYKTTEDAVAIDETLVGYRIVKNTTNLSNDAPQFFDLRSYKVTEGDTLHIKNTSNSGGGTTIVYGFYSNESLTDGNGTVLPSSSTYISIDSSYFHTWSTAEFDDMVTVPTGAKLLIVTYNKYVSTNPVVKKSVTASAVEMIDDLTERVDGIDEATYVDEDEMRDADDTLVGYRIVNSTASLNNDGSQFFDLLAYEVTEGDVLHIVNTSNTEGATTRVYAFYSVESLTDSEDNILPDTSNNVAVDSEYVHTWASAVFDDVVTVPEGAKLLVVTKNKYATSNPVVYNRESTPVAEKVEELMGKTAEPKMAVSRSGEDVYVAYNDGSGSELVYWFGRVHTSTNNTLGLRQVGYRNVTRIKPSAVAGNYTLLCHQNGSDMFGAILIDNVWIGGNHDQDSTPTSTNVSWTITADGTAVSSGDYKPCFSVTVTAVNKISHPTWGDVLEETIVMTVEENRMRVNLTHDYKYSGGVGKTIITYYGMQTMFGSRSTAYIMTPNGKFPTMIAESSTSPSSKSFKKGDYPLFDRFVQRNPDGWCQRTWLDKSVGIGDHSWIADTDYIFVDGDASKFYHKIISNKAITEDMTYQWGGVYTWEKDKGQDLDDDIYKQDTLVSGTNIKTINGNSLLGSGGITLDCDSIVYGGEDLNYVFHGDTAADALAGLDAAINDKAGISSVTCVESPTSGANNVVTVTLDNGTSSSFNVKNGENGVSLGNVAIADDLETNDSTKVLSAKQGYVLNGLIGDGKIDATDLAGTSDWVKAKLTSLGWEFGKYLKSNATTNANASYCISAYIPMSDFAGHSITLCYMHGGSSSICTVWYDSNKTFVSGLYYSHSTSNARIVTISTSSSWNDVAYVRISLNKDAISSCYILDNTTNTYIFKGDEYLAEACKDRLIDEGVLKDVIITQATGKSTLKVMSQKAVTDEIMKTRDFGRMSFSPFDYWGQYGYLKTMSVKPYNLSSEPIIDTVCYKAFTANGTSASAIMLLSTFKLTEENLAYSGVSVNTVQGYTNDSVGFISHGTPSRSMAFTIKQNGTTLKSESIGFTVADKYIVATRIDIRRRKAYVKAIDKNGNIASVEIDFSDVTLDLTRLTECYMYSTFGGYGGVAETFVGWNDYTYIDLEGYLKTPLTVGKFEKFVLPIDVSEDYNGQVFETSFGAQAFDSFSNVVTVDSRHMRGDVDTTEYIRIRTGFSETASTNYDITSRNNNMELRAKIKATNGSATLKKGTYGTLRDVYDITASAFITPVDEVYTLLEDHECEIRFKYVTNSNQYGLYVAGTATIDMYDPVFVGIMAENLTPMKYDGRYIYGGIPFIFPLPEKVEAIPPYNNNNTAYFIQGQMRGYNNKIYVNMYSTSTNTFTEKQINNS